MRNQQKRAAEEQLAIKFDGEVFPTDVVPVQTGNNLYQPMKWGFTAFKGKQPIINARSETALEKPMFRFSMKERRCLIPASGYYEWKREGNRKTKYRLFDPDNPLYFAGCYRLVQDSDLAQFVILTRAAATNIAMIHDRMPVIIPRELAMVWLSETPDVIESAITEVKFQPAEIQ